MSRPACCLANPSISLAAVRAKIAVTAVLIAALFGVAVIMFEPARRCRVRRGRAYRDARHLRMAQQEFIAPLGGAPARPRSPELALALRNPAAPDGLTRSVVLSLGTGLSLLVAVALANSSIGGTSKTGCRNSRRITFCSTSARRSSAALKSRVVGVPPGTAFVEAPMLRGPPGRAERQAGRGFEGCCRCAVGSGHQPVT